MFKRCISLIIIFLCIFSFLPGTAYADTSSSQQQIVSEGGENWDAFLYISKYIHETELENVFDISLTVITQTRVEELFLIPSTDIVFVMDVSNTMREAMPGADSRYDAALTAAEHFMEKYHAQAQKEDELMPNAQLRAGFVAFNTDAHQIVGMTDLCKENDIEKFFEDEIKAETDKIIARYAKNGDKYVDLDYYTSKRFTNIQGGLRMANQLMEGSSATNKYIIFLSDGFPTTYCNGSSTNGYDPNYKKGNTQNEDGVFANRKLDPKRPCTYGTSYSDRAATKAQDEAASIKASGIKIFSIGVDLGGQTIKKYNDEDQKNNISQGFSVVDCYESGAYVIGAADDEDSYKDWLGNKIASGRAEYYFDSDSSSDLESAFSNIFTTIESQYKEAVEASWTLVDPMGDTSDSQYVEFISLYDKEGNFSEDPNSLKGELGEGEENTVEVENETIHWDFKQSGYTTMVADDVTSYYYELWYRVRLKNETAAFPANEGKELSTNGETTLKYMHTVNDDYHPHEIEFDVPSVKGWLGELSFTKLDGATGLPLSGAEFELSHNPDCSVCKGMYPGGWKVDIEAFTAVSDSDGLVSFSNIPSGHEYTLTEEKAPAGYIASNRTWPVTVAYDKTLIDGEPALESVGNYRYGQITVKKEISGAHSKADFDVGAFTIQLRDELGNLAGEISLPKQSPDDGLSWSHTFTELPAGKYTLYESKASTIKEGYICYPEYIYPDNSCIELGWGEAASGTVRNYYEYLPDNITVKVEKTWYDADDRDGIRPLSIDFTLEANGKPVQTKAATPDNGFKVSFEYDAAYKEARIEVYESGYTDKNGQHHELEKGENVPGYRTSLEGSVSEDKKLMITSSGIPICRRL